MLTFIQETPTMFLCHHISSCLSDSTLVSGTESILQNKVESIGKESFYHFSGSVFHQHWILHSYFLLGLATGGLKKSPSKMSNWPITTGSLTFL